MSRINSGLPVHVTQNLSYYCACSPQTKFSLCIFTKSSFVPVNILQKLSSPIQIHQKLCSNLGYSLQTKVYLCIFTRKSVLPVSVHQKLSYSCACFRNIFFLLISTRSSIIPVHGNFLCISTKNSVIPVPTRNLVLPVHVHNKRALTLRYQYTSWGFEPGCDE